MYKVTFHRTTLSQCVHHGDAGFWHITALSAPNISHHRLHNTQEYWQHEALETYITYIAGLLHKTNIFQDYTFSVINSDYANQSLFLCTKFYTPDIVLCQSRSWPFIAIYLSQMVFVKIHSRSFMKIVTRVFLVPVLNLYLNYTFNQIKHLQ